VRFRLATEADVLAVVALVESAYRGEASRAGWTTEADLLDGPRTDAEAVRSVLSDSASCVLLAEDGDGRLLGSVVITDEGESAAAVHVGMFAVRPTAQGRGIGRALLAQAEALGGGRFHRPLARMSVLAPRTELIEWYERRGYRRTGDRVPFHYDNPRLGLPRRDDLVFEILQKPLATAAD
jgi:ribosomal protein S18 acetylase RimI-like enzyme